MKDARKFSKEKEPAVSSTFLLFLIHGVSYNPILIRNFFQATNAKGNNSEVEKVSNKVKILKSIKKIQSSRSGKSVRKVKGRDGRPDRIELLVRIDLV